MKQRVFMAGGGTGGHVFPLVAVAHALVRLNPEVEPVFVGTARGMETRFVPEQGFELVLLDVLPMRGGGLRGALSGAGRAAMLLPKCRELVRQHQPVGVFSVGGYAAGPVTLAARTLGLPVALLEPNSIIGLANQLLAPLVDRAYTAFEITDSAFDPAVVRRLGVPLRPGFGAAPYALSSGRLRVLVLGGSQGAKALNEAVPAALSRASRTFSGLSVVHQCGQAHLEAVRTAYGDLGADFAEVVPFISDMPAALASADLVISRSGASALSEILAVGRPSILVPYPFASGDHQRVNAESAAAGGAAICLSSHEATVERIEREVLGLASSQRRLVAMASSAQRLGRPDAAIEIARDFLALSGLSARAEHEGSMVPGGAGGAAVSRQVA